MLCQPVFIAPATTGHEQLQCCWPVIHAPVAELGGGRGIALGSGTGPVIDVPLRGMIIMSQQRTRRWDTNLWLNYDLRLCMGVAFLLLPVIVLLWATESRSTRIKRLRSNGWT